MLSLDQLKLKQSVILTNFYDFCDELVTTSKKKMMDCARCQPSYYALQSFVMSYEKCLHKIDGMLALGYSERDIQELNIMCNALNSIPTAVNYACFPYSCLTHAPEIKYPPFEKLKNPRNAICFTFDPIKIRLAKLNADYIEICAELDDAEKRGVSDCVHCSGIGRELRVLIRLHKEIAAMTSRDSDMMLHTKLVEIGWGNRYVLIRWCGQTCLKHEQPIYVEPKVIAATKTQHISMDELKLVQTAVQQYVDEAHDKLAACIIKKLATCRYCYTIYRELQNLIKTGEDLLIYVDYTIKFECDDSQFAEIISRSKECTDLNDNVAELVATHICPAHNLEKIFA